MESFAPMNVSSKRAAMASRASLFLALVVVLAACCQIGEAYGFMSMFRKIKLGFEPIGNKYYLIKDNAKEDWDAASLICQSMGANLAWFENIDEMNAVAEALEYKNIHNYGRLWTSGASDDLYQKKKFSWVAHDGGEINKDMWHSGEPNVKSCVHLSKQHYRYALNTIACSSKLGYICQFSRFVNI